MTLLQTVVLISRLAMLPIIVGSLEFLYAPAVLSDDGLMSWTINRLRAPWLCSGITGRLLNVVLSYAFIRSLLVVRVVLACAILFSSMTPPLHPVLFLSLAIVEALFVLRTPYGKDGSDQLTWLTVLSLTLASLWPSTMVLQAMLYFLVFQVCFSYFISGVAKASAKKWWNGTYLTSIANMTIYGNPRSGDFLLRHKFAAVFLSVGIIVWECAFPFLLLLPHPFVVVVLVSGLLFHLSNAVFMGLNCFFLSFAALYPALFFVTASGLLWS